MNSAESIFDKNIESIFSKLFRIKKAKINQPVSSRYQTSSVLDTKREVILYSNKKEGGLVYREESAVTGSHEKEDTREVNVYIY